MSEFEQGYVCAVATLLRSHGEDSYAKELIGALGIKDWSDIDPYDYEPLRKAGIAPKRRKP